MKDNFSQIRLRFFSLTNKMHFFPLCKKNEKDVLKQLERGVGFALLVT